MLYEFRQGKNAVEATNPICSVYGIDTLEVRTCLKCFARFSSGCYDLEDQQRSGRPQKAKSEDLLDENPHQTAIELALKLSVHQLIISRRLHELGKIQKEKRFFMENSYWR